MIFLQSQTVQTIAFLAWLNYQKGGGTSVDNAISIDEVKKSSIEAINLDETMDSDNNDTFMQDNSNDCSAKNPTIRRPHLIVVPASVLSNWMNEFQKFAPHMTVVKYHGNQNEREEIKYQMRKYLPVDKDTPPNAHLDAVLTTFSYFSSEKGEDR
jgi:SNF2 family DNA or RNA helicase